MVLGMATLDLLSTIEAAEVIDVERSVLSRWVASGRIAVAHKLPGRNGAMLFARSEVDRVAAEYALERRAASPSSEVVS